MVAATGSRVRPGRSRLVVMSGVGRTVHGRRRRVRVELNGVWIGNVAVMWGWWRWWGMWVIRWTRVRVLCPLVCHDKG